MPAVDRQAFALSCSEHGQSKVYSTAFVGSYAMRSQACSLRAVSFTSCVLHRLQEDSDSGEMRCRTTVQGRRGGPEWHACNLFGTLAPEFQ